MSNFLLLDLLLQIGLYKNRWRWFVVSCDYLMDTKLEVHVVKMYKAVFQAWSTIQRTKLTEKKPFSD